MKMLIILVVLLIMLIHIKFRLITRLNNKMHWSRFNVHIKFVLKGILQRYVMYGSVINMIQMVIVFRFHAANGI